MKIQRFLTGPLNAVEVVLFTDAEADKAEAVAAAVEKETEKLRYDAADLPVLIALLPNAAAFKGQMEWADGSGESSQYSEYPWLEECVDACMPALREAAEGCPACMLAALRQSGCIGFAEFNWMEERERFLRDANERRWEGVACGGLD